MRRTILGLIAGLSLFATAAQGAAPAEKFDLASMPVAERAAFLRDFPKGGDLHLHLVGAVYPENLLQWAREDGLCADVRELALRDPPCDASPDLKPAAQALADAGLLGRMLDSLTTRHPGFAGRDGHDQFFTTFMRADYAPTRVGDMVAEVRDRMAREHAYYAELMLTPQSGPARVLGRGVGWKGDLRAQQKADADAGLARLVEAAVAETDAVEARAKAVLKCGTPEAHPGCAVTVRYLVQTNRVVALEETFAQLDLGVALIKRDPRWVGLQLVAPEDHPNALRNYREHMEMIRFLTDGGRRANVSLHAGELTPALATPEDLSFHIAAAVHAGARRIGHGVDLAHEDGAEALVREMADKGVAVEVNLTSNDVILGVSGASHPWHWLRKAGAPFTFSTDDPGISRTDLSGEYERAAEDGADYDDLVRSARNAIAFSFLSGAPLWRDPNHYQDPQPDCAADMGRPEPSSAACRKLLAGSDKAREQWRYERLLHDFEAARAH